MEEPFDRLWAALTSHVSLAKIRGDVVDEFGSRFGQTLAEALAKYDNFFV